MNYLLGLIFSKTFWLNVLFVVVYIANKFGGFNDFIPDPTIVDAVTNPVTQGIVNIVIRFFTKSNLGDKWMDWMAALQQSK